MARPFFTYMVQCSDKSYYVGHTDDLERRLAQRGLHGYSPADSTCLV